MLPLYNSIPQGNLSGIYFYRVSYLDVTNFKSIIFWFYLSKHFSTIKNIEEKLHGTKNETTTQLFRIPYKHRKHPVLAIKPPFGHRMNTKIYNCGYLLGRSTLLFYFEKSAIKRSHSNSNTID